MTKPLTPMEHVEALADYLPVVSDVLISHVVTDARGQTAQITFSEDTHPLHDLFTNTLKNQVPSKQFKILLVELDDNGVPVNQTRRDQVHQMMDGQGRFEKQFYAIIRNEEFHRYLYTVGVKAMKSDQSNSERAELARGWSDSIGIDPQALDKSNSAFTVFSTMMRDPFYAWLGARKARAGR